MTDPSPVPPPGPDPAPASPRKTFFGVVMILMLFYLAVFAALNLLDFKFPMPILYSLFLLIAVPLALVTVGLVHFTYLVRVQFGSTTAKPPAPSMLVSLFVGTTVLVSAYFVSVYPEWRQAASETWSTEMMTKLPPEVAEPERKRLSRDVGALWLKYWQIIELEGTEAAENHPELTTAFQYVVSAVTSDGIDAEQYRHLRGLVPAYTKAATAVTSNAARPVTIGTD